jgi:uncharacterized protein YaaR (DUF327 family)
MIYKGVAYDYAFEFGVPVSYKATCENFRIVISKFREKTCDFSGLCLENELTIISDERVPFWAFVDIINETLDITTSSIMDYAEAHNGRIPKPHREVKNEEFIKKFNEKKDSAESLFYKEQLKNYYDQLGEYLIKPENTIKEIYKEQEPDFNNYLFMTFFKFLLCAKLPKVNNMKIFPI